MTIKYGSCQAVFGAQMSILLLETQAVLNLVLNLKIFTWTLQNFSIKLKSVCWQWKYVWILCASYFIIFLSYNYLWNTYISPLRKIDIFTSENNTFEVSLYSGRNKKVFYSIICYAHSWEIFLTLEDKIRISARPCNILYVRKCQNIPNFVLF